MLYVDRIDVSEGIHVNETGESKESILCHHWYFLDKGFKSRLNVCNALHYVLIMSMNLKDIAILNNRGVDYRSIINGINKSNTIDLFKNA